MAAYDITEVENYSKPLTTNNQGDVKVIDATHFVGVTPDNSNDGRAMTFSLDGSYQVTLIDELEHDTDLARWNTLQLYKPNRFVIAYGGTNDDGFIKTFSYDGSYDNITQIASLEHDLGNGTWNCLDLIDSTHPILAYSGSGSDGFVSIFTIDGSDGIAETSTFEFEVTDVTDVQIKVINSTHALITWIRPSGGQGVGLVVTWDGSYAISAVGSVFEFSSSNTSGLAMEKLDTEYYAVSYRGEAGTDVYVKILRVNISSSYALSEIDSEIVSTNTSSYTQVKKLGDGILFMVWADTVATDGIALVLTYDGSYTLTAHAPFTYSSTSIVYPRLDKIDTNHILYQDGSTYRVFEIELPANPFIPKVMMIN